MRIVKRRVFFLAQIVVLFSTLFVVTQHNTTQWLVMIRKSRPAKEPANYEIG